MSWRLGIDVGGTFTDFLLTGRDRRLVHKTSSTPEDPSQGVEDGLREIAEQLETTPEDFVSEIELIVHGTTVSTNATLTRSGSTTGLLTTEGFRDALALRDGRREETYNNRLLPPEPLVPRYRRLGVAERVDAQGEVATPLDEDSVRAAVDSLAAQGVEAVAVSFMHSPQNDGNERRAADLVRELLPEAYVTASSELLPQVRFYPRTSTTVLNAYVGPIIQRYMTALTERLEGLGFGGVLLIMQSNGGVATPAEVSKRAAVTLLSGPAAGPTAGLAALSPHGLDDCLTIDMGGTSFDAALVKDGDPLVMTDGELDRWRLALPMIDIHTIGAGGGSIAQIDEGGLLHVGPESAGASPGPACYGRGGERPTVTDADLLLGFLNPESFLHGAMRLDLESARRAIEEHVAGPLGMSAQEAAAGIYDLVNVSMAAGVRDVTVRRGLDPRDFPLVVAGGAGPVHASAIAEELEIPLLVVPRESSIFCASGMLVSDFKHDLVRALKEPMQGMDPARVGALLDEMAEAGTEILQREGLAEERIRLGASLDLRYVGQWHEIAVAADWRPGQPPDLERLVASFHEQHDRMFGYSTPGAAIESLAARVSAIGITEKSPPQAAGASIVKDAEEALIGERPVWSATARSMLDTPVYDGRRLGPSSHLKGPAIIEMSNTTIVVLEGFHLAVDDHGSFIVYSDERGRALASQLAPEAIATPGP